ncbi:MAG: BamA/TamA family outer membrane protein [Gemmatimonadetes bacterium]|nr:BamA/TamA family outer membrane protein [Gemmatimonadota bacterium]NIR80793.1 BamA/TamA family outer membrane protein [Gemmatimonadota bacterium]NIT89613.1 BamA/TamA family outer membrane protein [Gemmatimonadota bacterium]NIU33393.1 BamA/TamA family outer membrane protein [Gemmatimonadota bacterium]NIU37685.1 BamA/TamA family outer membrane protein [Gemmatimonadota bacterium]
MINIVLSLILALLLAAPGAAQENGELPTVERPVRITVEPAADAVAPGDRSALLVTFRVPKYMWLGARAGADRTPPGTKVRMQEHPAFRFEEPVFPEPEVEGVPVHLGVTRVYMGEVRVVVPFTVAGDAEPGEHEVTARLTYTPGFDAGKLTTHVNEPHTGTVRVARTASRRTTSLPEPATADVPTDFRVQPKEFDVPAFVGPMMHQYEESAFTRALHFLFMDPESHGKTIRHAVYPFIMSTEQEGKNFGGGMAFLNSTREGIMTGALSMLAFDNQFLGATLGFDFITCPAAYKNLRMSARIGLEEEYQELTVQWEDFTWGADDRWGVQVDARGINDPRFRFYGLGPETDENDVSVYEHEELGAVVDLYHLPVDKLRVGLGFKVRSVDVARGIRIADEGFSPIPATLDRFAGTTGLGGSDVVGGRFNVIFDQRNQEFTPSSGFFGKVTAEYDRIVGDEGTRPVDDYGRFLVDMRQYFSTVDQKLTVLMRGEATFTTSEAIPFFEQATLGGPESLRAFDRGRFFGQHAVFGSAEMRYTMMNMTMFGYPMEVVMGGFLDVGQVFGGDTFGDDFQVNPGGSLRFVNPPNVGYILSVAHGEDGVNVTGGISLPF